MIQRLHGNLEFGVVVVDGASGQPLPEVVHEDITYVVCTAEQEFKVQVSCKPLKHWKHGQRYQSRLYIDGNGCGSCRTLKKRRQVYTFTGWWINHKTKKKFVFSAPSAVQGDSEGLANDSELGSLKVVFTEAEDYPCPALAGTKCSQCNFVGLGTKTVTKCAPDKAASMKQGEDKKFFLQPSMCAKAGARLDQEPRTRKTVHCRRKPGGSTYSLQMRFETAPILQLRKILVPSNPTHARIIAASANAGQAAARDSQAEPSRQAGGASVPSSRVVKTESKVVKKEKRRSPNARVIETVDLTEDASEDQDCMMYTVAKRVKLEGERLQID